MTSLTLINNTGLCWSCARATNSEKYPCVWASSLTVPEGAVYENGLITTCPLYECDDDNPRVILPIEDSRRVPKVKTNKKDIGVRRSMIIEHLKEGGIWSTTRLAESLGASINDIKSDINCMKGLWPQIMSTGRIGCGKAGYFWEEGE